METKHGPEPIPVDDKACERLIATCFQEVSRMLEEEMEDCEELGGDPIHAMELALQLFKDFIRDVKQQLPREPRRRKPPSKRDAELIKNYNAAKKGTRSKLLSDFEKKYNLAEGSALRIYRRHIQHTAQGVFREALKESARKG